MREARDIEKGLTPLQRLHMEFMNEKNYKKDRASSYRPARIEEEWGGKTQIFKANARNKQVYIDYGLKFMRDKSNQVAVVIMAGGNGCRADLPEGKSKQFYQIFTFQNQKEIEIKKTTLFQVVFDSLDKAFKQKWNIILYIICSRKNSSEIIRFIDEEVESKYNDPTIYICYQHEGNVLDENGMESIYTSKETREKLQYSDGIGTFGDARLIYGEMEEYSLSYHITEITKPRLVYCIGTSNSKETGLNLEMIGLIAQRDLDVVFSCSPGENRASDLPLVCIRNESNQDSWLVMESDNVKKLFIKPDEAKECLLWMDNFVFDPKILAAKPKATKSLLKYQFNDRTLKNQKLLIRCKIAEVTISYGLLGNKEKCVGYMQEDGIFMKSNEDFMESQKRAQSYSPSRIIKRKGTVN